MLAKQSGDRRTMAETFLAALVGSADEPVTFQTFPDGEGESAAGPVVIHATLAEAWDRLLDLQEHGHGVFVMVNEGDGRGRSAGNVRALRALFADDDTGAVRGSGSIGVMPSIVVSSGNGVHFYWLLKGGEALESFTPAQKGIAAKLGTDPKVCDLARVLRLPGTYNLKDRSKPQPVDLLWCRREGLRGVSEILAGLKATPIATEGARGSMPAGPRVLSGIAVERARAYVKEIVAIEGQGGDTQTFKAAAVLLNDFGLSPAQAWEMLREWNQTNASPPWEEKALGEKFRHAQRYGKAPVGSKLAEAMSEVPPRVVDAAVAASPILDPTLYAFNASPETGGKPWLRWRDGVWRRGISTEALDRTLANEGGLTSKRMREAWKQRVPVVDDAAPAYDSTERIVVYDDRKVANTYRRSTLKPIDDGDWTPIDRILYNLVDGDLAAQVWLEGWLAKLVQNVWAGRPARIGTAPVFTGAKGSGKGTLEEVCKALLGKWNVASITQRELSSDFNSWLDGCLLVFANEVWSSDARGTALASKLKDAITCIDRMINRKGVPEYSRGAVENWIFASNAFRPVEIERGDRRFTVFRTGPAIDVALGAQVAEDARRGGPIVRAFLAHLLALPADRLVEDYRPLPTAAKDDVQRASGNSANKFARGVATRGFWSLTGAWAGTLNLGPRDLYLMEAGQYRAIEGHPESPVLLKRKLMDVYRAYSQEINAPAGQETTLLAALREEVPGLFEGELLVDGRRERVVSGLPGMFPVGLTTIRRTEPALPQQHSLNL